MSVSENREVYTSECIKIALGKLSVAFSSL
jgi:hypothetical protein